MKLRRMEIKLAILAIASSACFWLLSGPASAASQAPVCPGPASPGSARCHAYVTTNANGTPKAETAPKGYGPLQFRGAYGLPAAASTPQTIAIVDAYDDPKIASDLNVYSKQFGLPECNSSNPCFEKVNQSGSAAGPFPQTSAGWSLEIALDVEVEQPQQPRRGRQHSRQTRRGRDLEQLRRLRVLGRDGLDLRRGLQPPRRRGHGLLR